MKAFWLYTLARFAVFAVTYVVVWGVASIWFDPPFVNLFVLLTALVVSSLVAFFALRGLRDALAQNISGRAERLSRRIDESRSAEDVD
jgi:uncharacterized membrane protein YdjX (TVP38/TMEM64 family)